jgi:hypothetical protein
LETTAQALFDVEFDDRPVTGHDDRLIVLAKNVEQVEEDVLRLLTIYQLLDVVY